jgi:shikimate dehydrogenase
VIRLAVFGHPVTHSLSPGIHARFARQFGLDIDYRAIDCTEADFGSRLGELAASGGRGCNITVPLKRLAWELAQGHSKSARRARAANTLLFERPDHWYADNTDGRGLVRDLTANLGRVIEGAAICLVGAGGAAAGVLGDLLDLDPAGMTIANRSPDKAAMLAGRHARVESCGLDALRHRGSFDLIINATSLGHSGRHPELPVSVFAPGALCYDMNYGAASKPLADFCRAAAIEYSHGFGMLAEQAALSFELWTGHAPDTRPVLEAYPAN